MGSAADAGYGSSGGHALGAGAGASTAAANGKGPTPFALRSGDDLGLIRSALGPGLMPDLNLSPHASMVAAAEVAAAAAALLGGH